MTRSFQFLFISCVASAMLTGCGSRTREGRERLGWYFVGSNLHDEDAPGGFGPCNNFSKKCGDATPGTVGEFSLIAFPTEIVEFRNQKAIRLRLINRTEKTMEFAACDSALYLVQEARNSKGRWQTLERFPESFCGNSFHRVLLEPNEYWEVLGPLRKGSFKTNLRFRLEPVGERGIAAKEGTMFSNEYEGHINPADFVREARRD